VDALVLYFLIFV